MDTIVLYKSFGCSAEWFPVYQVHGLCLLKEQELPQWILNNGPSQGVLFAELNYDSHWTTNKKVKRIKDGKVRKESVMEIPYPDADAYMCLLLYRVQEKAYLRLGINLGSSVHTYVRST